MEKNNPKYLNQGIHVISSIFTIEKGIIKVLLIKRSNEPNKIQNFENILFQNPLNQILKNGFTLTHLTQTSKRLK